MDLYRVTKNSLYGIVGAVVPMGVALWALPNIAQGLEKEVYAVFLIGVSLLTASQVFAVGVSTATSKYLADELLSIREKSELLFSSFILHIAVGIASVILMHSVLPHLMDLMHIPKTSENLTYFRYTFLSFPFFLLVSFVRSAMEGLFKFHISNLIRVMFQSGILLISGIGTLLYHDIGVVGKMVFLWVFFACFISIIFFLSTSAGMLAFPNGSWRVIKILLRYSGWASIPGILGPLWFVIDRALLSRYASPLDVAIYGTAMEILARLWIVPASLSNALLPEVSSQWVSLHQKGHLRTILRKCTVALGIIMLPVFFFLGWKSDVFLQWWLHDRTLVMGLIPVFQSLSVGAWVNSMARVPAAFLRGFDKVDFIGKTILTEFVIYFMVAPFIVREGGAIALAALFSFRLIIDGWLLWIGAQNWGGKQNDSEVLVRVPG